MSVKDGMWEDNFVTIFLEVLSLGNIFYILINCDDIQSSVHNSTWLQPVCVNIFLTKAVSALGLHCSVPTDIKPLLNFLLQLEIFMVLYKYCIMWTGSDSLSYLRAVSDILISC